MPDDERPRERLERLGPQALKAEELLAILVRTGTVRDDVITVSQRLLREHGGVRGLGAADIATLAATHGVGHAKATTIAAAFELGRRLRLDGGDDRPQVTSPEHIAALLHAEMQLLQQEELRLILLDTKNRVLATPTLYRGTVSGAPGRLAEVYRDAVRRGASKLAIVHNHPSGDPTPSRDDVAFTREAAQAGRLLEIELLDHVVFGHGAERWVSMRRQRLGFDAS
ncbi:MAG: DNA repair protein RadC [Chloroflexi bacterium]|nr:DNA repair protein RadC [Chloroflexota bacterium]MQC17900.1 DNA repair protein RadC [Chloroflexota bacterium]MQC48446.1 DNA repair protein RadC [Chloroflexota bacterium]